MPLRQAEVDVFSGIADEFRRWADAMDSQVSRVGALAQGPQWTPAELADIFESWLHAGHCIRDLARSDPAKADPGEARPETLKLAHAIATVTHLLQESGTQNHLAEAAMPELAGVDCSHL